MPHERTDGVSGDGDVTEYHVHESDSLTAAVERAVEVATDDEVAWGDVTWTVDPEALEAVFEEYPGGPDRDGVHVRFTVGDAVVTVVGGDEIRVEP